MNKYLEKIAKDLTYTAPGKYSDNQKKELEKYHGRFRRYGNLAAGGVLGTLVGSFLPKYKKFVLPVTIGSAALGFNGLNRNFEKGKKIYHSPELVKGKKYQFSFKGTGLEPDDINTSNSPFDIKSNRAKDIKGQIGDAKKFYKEHPEVFDENF